MSRLGICACKPYLVSLNLSACAAQEGPAAREGNAVPVGTASRKTGETVGAADALMDALELAAHETQRMQVTEPGCCIVDSLALQGRCRVAV